MRRFTLEHLGPVSYIFVGMFAVVALAVLMWLFHLDTLVPVSLAGGGLAVVITIFSGLMTVPDDLQSRTTESILKTASATLKHMRGGMTPEHCQAVCLLLLPETEAAAIALTDTTSTLAYVGEDLTLSRSGTPNSAPVQEVLSSGRMQTFTNMRQAEWDEVVNLRHEAAKTGSHVARCPVSLILPLVVSERVVGTMKLYYRRGRDVNRTQIAIAQGLAELLATQLTVSELDRQAELTAQAEVRALQAQINPHFLFNTLNTMASLTRTDPDRARNLLREFSLFYRGTLENSQQQIRLSVELEQTRRYLSIEKARFGEDRIVLSEAIEPGCEGVLVPGFVIQPVVENAVRHAMRDDGPLHIDVRAAFDGYDLVISVSDDGLGMDEETIMRILRGSSQEASHESKGTGVAIRNVAERVELSFGAGSGVQIRSELDVGTCVTLRLANAAQRAFASA